MATGRVKWQTLTGVEGVEGEEHKGRQSLLRYMFTGLLTVEVTWTRRKALQCLQKLTYISKAVVVLT